MSAQSRRWARMSTEAKERELRRRALARLGVTIDRLMRSALDHDDENRLMDARMLLAECYEALPFEEPASFGGQPLGYNDAVRYVRENDRRLAARRRAERATRNRDTEAAA